MSAAAKRRLSRGSLITASASYNLAGTYPSCRRSMSCPREGAEGEGGRGLCKGPRPGTWLRPQARPASSGSHGVAYAERMLLPSEAYMPPPGQGFRRRSHPADADPAA